jgi:hypothetical protein
MNLYTVSVFGRDPGKARKVLVLTYATIAASPNEAAGNISRENAVLPEDRLIVKECDTRTVVLPSRMIRSQDLIMRVIQDGTEFAGSELPSREEV